MVGFKVRGLIALAILRELEKGPVHGYALMTRFEEMYGFKPSPGAIYPVLKRLTDMGFIDVEVRSEDGRRVKVYSIT
jgi:DNA-binding PadR family transcriptional regulator